MIKAKELAKVLNGLHWWNPKMIMPDPKGSHKLFLGKGITVDRFFKTMNSLYNDLKERERNRPA